MTPSLPGVMRLAALVIVAVVLELAVVSQITVLGANIDLLVLIALSVGLLGGPIAGATTGFLLGLVADMALQKRSEHDVFAGPSSLVLVDMPGYGYAAA